MANEASVKSPGRKWTPAQKLGITSTGHSLLVSAAAGSGKTTVLAERCVYLVCDAKPVCNVDELLVVTFTESAAAEMRARINKALRERQQQNPADDRLARQLLLVEQAQVSTLHAFCARLLRQHFHLANLDAGFRVMDADEASLLRREVARDLFEHCYDDEGGSFHRLIDGYGQGNDEGVLKQLLHVHELLTSVVDPDNWIERSRERIQEAIEGPLEKSELGRELTSIIQRGLDSIQLRCAEARQAVAGLEFPQYAGFLGEIGAVLGYWQQAFGEHGIDGLAEVVRDPQWPRLPTVRGGDAGRKEIAKQLVDDVRDEIAKGAWRDILRFSSKQWQDGLAKMQPHADLFLQLVDQFGKNYREAKRAVRSVDFSDLERLALDALQRHQSLGYHRRFAHVLVDEYQDINELQDKILSLVSRECLATGRRAAATASNLFCVGDVKQSIYRFRLAEPKRFLDKQKDFRKKDSHGRVIDLQSNFRSRRPLLDAINHVFRNLMTEEAVNIQYDTSHELVGELDYPILDDGRTFNGSPIDLHLLPADRPGRPEAGDDGVKEGDEDDDELDRTEREAVLVALEIKKFLGHDRGTPCKVVMETKADGTLIPRDATFRDVVILLRSMKFKADQFVRMLRQFDIPVHAESRSGYFESMEVRDMLSLLALLDNRRQDIPLTSLLRSPLSGFPLAERETALARIRLAYSHEKGRASSSIAPLPATAQAVTDEGQLSPESGQDASAAFSRSSVGDNVQSTRPDAKKTRDAIPFHEAAGRYGIEKNDSLATALRHFFANLNRWRQAAQRRPLADVIWDVYRETGYLAYVAGLDAGEQRVENLLDLHRRAAQFGDFQNRGLSRFLRFLNQLRDESDLGQPSIASEADNVVRILSIHKSKGLEFPIVFVPDLGKNINMQDCQGPILADRQSGLGMVVVDDARRCRYPSLASTLVKSRLRQQSLAEELRVLYVAMTRAREHLVLVGTANPKAFDNWGVRWSAHPGPLPTDAILGVRSMLDWLGPVSQITARKDVFNVNVYTTEQVSTWRANSTARSQTTPEQEMMARLQPLTHKPPVSPAVQATIDRLKYVYPWQAYSNVPAAQSVTTRAHSAESVGDADSPTFSINPSHISAGFSRSESSLPKPKFVEEIAPNAADRGTATHLLLEHLKLSSSCDDADIRRQIDALIAKRIVTTAQASLIDMEAVHWFLSTEIGQRMRRDPSAVRREVPVNFPVAPLLPGGAAPSGDLLDRIMVRGRLDALILGKNKCAILLDYKTDSIKASDAAARAETYKPQLFSYKVAIEAITGLKIEEAWLAFLTPRVMEKLKWDNLAG